MTLRPPSRLALTHFVRPPTRDDDASPSRVVMTRHPPLVPPHSTATAPCPRAVLTHLIPPHRTMTMAPHPRVALTHLVRLSTCDDNDAGVRER
jgi:hypothetical protein